MHACLDECEREHASLCVHECLCVAEVSADTGRGHHQSIMANHHGPHLCLGLRLLGHTWAAAQHVPARTCACAGLS